MSFPDGTEMAESGGLRLKRLAGAIPSGYTIFKYGSTIYGETNIPDGTNYSDPSSYATVFNNCAAALPNGGTIYHKRGAYTLDAQITLGNYIRAVYAPLCSLTTSHATDPAILLNGTKSQFVGEGFVDIYHVQGTTAICIDDCTEALLENVWVNGADTASSIGVEIECGTAVYYPTIKYCRFYNLEKGLWTNRSAGSLNRIRSLFTRYTNNEVGTGYGAYVDYGTGHVFIGCEFSTNDVGFYYDGSSANMFGCTWDNQNTYDIQLGGSHQALGVFGGVVYTTVPAVQGALHALDRFDFTGDKYGADSGTATLLDNTTSIAVTHNLGYTPTLQDISATPTSTLNAANCFWVADPTATDFDIHVDADPDANVDFVWQIKRTGS